MASCRYERDIDPKDLTPRKEQQYSRMERWTDCPVLADYCIGIRGAWLKESASLLENSETLWANLTAGAVSTAGEGH